MMILRTGNKGFSLAEVMIAVAILSVGLTAVIRAYIVSLDVLDSCQAYIDSLALAKEKVAEIKLSKGLEPGVYQGTAQGHYSLLSWESQVIPSDKEGMSVLNVSVSSADNNFAESVSLVSYVPSPKEE